jgi:hypothetical protein
MLRQRDSRQLPSDDATVARGDRPRPAVLGHFAADMGAL